MGDRGLGTVRSEDAGAGSDSAPKLGWGLGVGKGIRKESTETGIIVGHGCGLFLNGTPD